MKYKGIGDSVLRKEAPEKVTGDAKYNADYQTPGLLHCWMVTSLYAHAYINGIDTADAAGLPGVHAIVTGDASPNPMGSLLEDRPPLAVKKVRYFGEPIAVVVADSAAIAKQAAGLVNVHYHPLPVVNSPNQALKSDAPLVHEQLGTYGIIKPEVYPEAGTNVAHSSKIRKGDMDKGWAESEVIVESQCSLPQSDHAAMETRNVRVEIKPDGRVIIHTATQAPFTVKHRLSKYFKIDEGKIIVHTPLVGGAFGGKTAVQLEFIAYLASKAVGGRMVKLVNSREQDITSSPAHLGIEAKIKLGATKDGILKAAEITYLVDIGAYADSGPKMTKSMAVDCVGPYNIENIWCDALSVYTNHTYVTAFRGFGHLAPTFAIERSLDKLAFKLDIDPWELRYKNAIKPEDTNPTYVRMNKSNVGDLHRCLERLKEILNWHEGIRIETADGKVRAKGISCLWKTSSSPPNATSGAILTLNKDGTINLNCGAIEFGEGSKTTLAQILAEKMKVDINDINVFMDVNTEVSPMHWKTVASMTNYMVGNAVLDAAEDLIKQLKSIAAIVLRCPPEVLEVAGGKVFLNEDPDISVAIKEIAHGYKYDNGSSIGGQIIGRGNFIMKHLTKLDQNTGKGRTGPAWTVGAQAVEVEFNPKDCSYKILKAATVIDAGKVLHPKMARGIVTGGMCMGLGYGTREHFIYDVGGKTLNPQFRTYHLMRFGENPDYLVEFVETPQMDAPFGQRGLGEHGIIGIPVALANALSTAAQVSLDKTPLTPEVIWQTQREVAK